MATDPQGSTATPSSPPSSPSPPGSASFAVLWRLAGDQAGVAGQPSRAARTTVIETPTGSHRQSSLDRRRFVIGVGGVLVAAGAAMASRGGCGPATRSTPSGAATVLPPPGAAPRRRRASQPFEVAGLSPYVTPNDDFYRIDTALMTPQVDAAGW